MKTTFDKKTNSIVNAETGDVIYTAPTGKKIIEPKDGMVHWTIKVKLPAPKMGKPKWGIYSSSGKLLNKFYLKKFAVASAKCFRTKVTVRRLKNG